MESALKPRRERDTPFGRKEGRGGRKSPPAGSSHPFPKTRPPSCSNPEPLASEPLSLDFGKEGAPTPSRGRGRWDSQHCSNALTTLSHSNVPQPHRLEVAVRRGPFSLRLRCKSCLVVPRLALEWGISIWTPRYTETRRVQLEHRAVFSGKLLGS